MNVVDFFLYVALLLMMCGSFCMVVGAMNYSKRFFKFAAILAVAHILVKMFVPH